MLFRSGWDLAFIGDEQIIMRADESEVPPEVGATVQMAARKDRLHWFDAGSGKRIDT